MSAPRRNNRLILGGALAVAALSLLVILLSAGGSSKQTSPVKIIRTGAGVRAMRPVPHTTPQRASPAPSAAMPQAAPEPTPPANPAASLETLVGQRVMMRMNGTSPDPELLQAIKAGHVGGVILYSDNIVSPSQTAALNGQLQQAARAGGNPPLLISTDQEGGLVRRLPWAAPVSSAEAIGAAGSAAARSEGLRTGSALRAAGVNVNLAPVADVAHSQSAFIWQQQRSFGTNSAQVAADATAFAAGLRDQLVAATAKHFPGVGSAPVDTDNALQTLQSQPDDLVPYRTLIGDSVPIIMVSTAVYPNLDPSGLPAALSPTIINGVLRSNLGYSGVTMSDDLERPTGFTTDEAVRRAARAGIDIVLVCTSESAGFRAFDQLLASARAGELSMSQLQASDNRIRALKHQYAGA